MWSARSASWSPTDTPSDPSSLLESSSGFENSLVRDIDLELRGDSIISNMVCILTALTLKYALISKTDITGFLTIA